jgi:hypothetical protein
LVNQTIVDMINHNAAITFAELEIVDPKEQLEFYKGICNKILEMCDNDDKLEVSLTLNSLLEDKTKELGSDCEQTD